MLAALALAVLLASCQAQVSSAGKTVSLQQLGGGPVGGRVHLFAATSLAELQGLVWATGSTPSFSDCVGAASDDPALQRACWWQARVPSDALLLAAALVSPNCDVPRAVTAALSGPSTLVVTVDHGPTCRSGSSTASSLLSLLAVPLTDLPPLLIDVRLVHSGDPASGAVTEADLRTPVDRGGDPVAVAQDVRQAYVNAGADAGARLGLSGLVPTGVATRRWDDGSAGCPAPGRKYEHRVTRGYVVRMVSVSDLRHPVVEYHGPPSALVYCGVATPATATPARTG